LLAAKTILRSPSYYILTMWPPIKILRPPYVRRSLNTPHRSFFPYSDIYFLRSRNYTSFRSLRKRMIANQWQEDSENNNGFMADGGETSVRDLDANSLSSFHSAAPAVSAQKIPLTDWIQSGLMHKQMYRQKTTGVLKRDTTSESLLMSDYDGYSLSSSSDDFTYPVEKVRKVLARDV